MNSIKIDLNLLYIFFSLINIILIFTGQYNDTIFYDSKTQIIFFSLVIILISIRGDKNNIFLRIFIFYFFFFYFFNFFSLSLPNYPSFVLIRNISINTINENLNILLLHFISLYLIVFYFFRNLDDRMLIKNFNKKKDK